VTTVLGLTYLAAATCFVVGLHLMNTPRTARRGSLVSTYGMVAAAVATMVVLIRAGTVSVTGWIVLATGAVLGTTVGWYLARTVAMTAVPQVVSLFNAAGGGAAMLVAVHEFLRVDAAGDRLATGPAAAVALDVVIGAVTFSGSLIAAGKLQGVVASRPVVFPGARLIAGALALTAVGAGALLVAGRGGPPVLLVVAAAALALGVAMVMPIGGADMPVVISLLNALTGTAVAMAGIVIGNTVLIIAGALVGASGGILTVLMAEAMNRSLVSIVVGGFGTGDGPALPVSADARVRSVSAEDAAVQLVYAGRVIIVPGYGLAAAQAQHEVRELAELLEAHGVDVCYAVHPVAGRLPGHMNVLLAEANVPYRQLKEMDEVNPEFARADVALVVGANDVVNPAARHPGNPVSGMPILDVDRARSVIVIKRSMGHGYAGIDNELYTDPKTGMYFADAKKGLAELAAAVKTLAGVGGR
jgi:NAD(P) transhydrogenase subunit beta